jgi:hypothetical protein
MATILNNDPITSFPVSLSGDIPGDAATGHVKRLVVDIVDNLAPYDTPVLKMVKKGKPYSNPKPEWITGADVEHTSATAEAVSVGEVAIDVTSGHGVRFQVNQTIAVFEDDSAGNPDFATREIMWVTGVNTDTLTVVRAQGGTTDSTFSSGAHIEILASAVPEGEDFVLSNNAYGDFYHNFFQTIQKGKRISEEGNVTENWEFDSSNHIARLMKNAGMEAKRELEKDLIMGGKQQGTNAAGSAQRPSMMGGINDFIVEGGHVTNLNNNVLNIMDIENEGKALWDSVGDEGAKKMLMSMNTARMLDGTFMRFRTEGDLDADHINTVFKYFETRFGRFEIVPTRWVPEGIILGVNVDHLSIHPYQGMDWTEKEHNTDGAYLWRSIYGRFTLKVLAPETMWKLYGFDTDLANYGRTS